jgi:hypothetical protein
MITRYSINDFVKGVNGFGSEQCFYIRSATLIANTDTTLAVPSNETAMGIPLANFNKFLAIINCTSNVFLSFNSAATFPGGAAFAATSSELIVSGEPYAKQCKDGDVLHFRARGTPDVTVSFYAIV